MKKKVPKMRKRSARAREMSRVLRKLVFLTFEIYD